MISPDSSPESLFGRYGQYSVGLISDEDISTPTDLLDIEKMKLVPVCSTLLIAPKTSYRNESDLYSLFDEHIAKSLKEIFKEYILVHPAYAKGVKNYTHVLDKIINASYGYDATEYSDTTVRFDGATVYANSNREFYKARPLSLTLTRGERHDWHQSVSSNQFWDISAQIKDGAENRYSTYVEKLIKESGASIDTILESNGLYLCEDLTCVVPKSQTS